MLETDPLAQVFTLSSCPHHWYLGSGGTQVFPEVLRALDGPWSLFILLCIDVVLLCLDIGMMLATAISRNYGCYRSSGIQLGAGIALTLPLKVQWAPPSPLPAHQPFLVHTCKFLEEINSEKFVLYQYFKNEISKVTKKAACPENWCLPYYFHMAVEIVMCSCPHALQTQEGVSVSGTGTGDALLQHGVPGVAKTQHLWGGQLSGCAHATHADALSTEPHFCLRWKTVEGSTRWISPAACYLFSLWHWRVF